MPSTFPILVAGEACLPAGRRTLPRIGCDTRPSPSPSPSLLGRAQPPRSGSASSVGLSLLGRAQPPRSGSASSVASQPPRRLMGAAEPWPESPIVGETPSKCPEHGRAPYKCWHSEVAVHLNGPFASQLRCECSTIAACAAERTASASSPALRASLADEMARSGLFRWLLVSAPAWWVPGAPDGLQAKCTATSESQP